uniref:Uncharacterized protein n=1 Tax=Oryza brachyantha TaxID=4533 RepID=J3ME39_ORYBR
EAAGGGRAGAVDDVGGDERRGEDAGAAPPDRRRVPVWLLPGPAALHRPLRPGRLGGRHRLVPSNP